MRCWAWLASVTRASRSAAIWRLAASSEATLAMSSARSGPSISAPSWRRTQAAERVPFGAHRRISSLATASSVRRLAWVTVRRERAGLRTGNVPAFSLALPGGFDVLADAVGVGEPGGKRRRRWRPWWR